jgi:hypothetical protein
MTLRYDQPCRTKATARVRRLNLIKRARTVDLAGDRRWTWKGLLSFHRPLHYSRRSCHGIRARLEVSAKVTVRWSVVLLAGLFLMGQSSKESTMNTPTPMKSVVSVGAALLPLPGLVQAPSSQ